MLPFGRSFARTPSDMCQNPLKFLDHISEIEIVHHLFLFFFRGVLPRFQLNNNFVKTEKIRSIISYFLTFVYCRDTFLRDKGNLSQFKFMLQSFLIKRFDEGVSKSFVHFKNSTEDCIRFIFIIEHYLLFYRPILIKITRLMQVNILPNISILRPCPPFRAFRWRVGDEVDDLSRANRRFAFSKISCGGRGRVLHGPTQQIFLFFVFLYIFRGFRVMDEPIKKNPLHEIEVHQQRIMHRLNLRGDPTMVHPPFFLM